MVWKTERKFSQKQKILLIATKNKLMKNKTNTIVFTALITLLGFFILTSFDNPEEDIVGSWILENDINSKWTFTDDGHCYWYYDSILVDSFTYSISETSPQCGFEVKTGGSDDYYLKLIDHEYEEYCYEIYNLNDENLSINFLGLSEIKLFNKE